VTSFKRIPLISLWQAEGDQLHESQHAYEDRQTDGQTQDRQTITSLQSMKYSYCKYASDLAYEVTNAKLCKLLTLFKILLQPEWAPQARKKKVRTSICIARLVFTHL